MKWSSGVSDSTSLVDAVSQAAEGLIDSLGGLQPDLTVVFVSAHHASMHERVPELLAPYAGEGVLVGCSGGGVIGAGREVEHRPGLAIAGAHLPDVQLRPFHVEDQELPDADAGPVSWEALVGTEASREPHFLLLVDPFSIRAEDLLMGLDFAFPTSSKVGGLASGAQLPGGNALFLGDEGYTAGAVGVAMHGALAVDTIVAQGCRPIGDPMRVTGCERNLLLELDARNTLEVVQGLVEGLSERDRHLARHSLFLGVVMDGLNESPRLGDYLIRNIIGLDRERGGLAIGELLREGQVVQFHLRDAETSAEDLDEMLSSYAAEHPEVADEAGALLFSCVGRGEGLYGRPDHDTDMFRDKVSPVVPLSGFFCNGEIGPVGDATYLHGYTSSFGIFRPG